MENTPNPRPRDILEEARSYENFDAWLTNIPDTRLQEIINIVQQVNGEKVEDENTLAKLIAVSMHFRNKQLATIPEVTKSFEELAIYVGVEANVRNGIIEKQGEYSMETPSDEARFTLTEKGMQIYGEGGDKA